MSALEQQWHCANVADMGANRTLEERTELPLLADSVEELLVIGGGS